MGRYLIIRLSSIGDIVLTTPVIRCLKDQLAGSEVHFLTKNGFLPVLQSNPYLDKIYTIDRSVSEVVPALKKENYDALIDLHHNLRSWQVKNSLKVKSFAFDKLNIQKWIAVNLKVNRLPPVHIVDRYFETVKQLGVSNDKAGLDYFIPVDEEVSINTLPSPHQNGFVAWVIGARHKTKIFPAQKVIEVCRLMNKPVILLGGKEDYERGVLIESGVNSKYIYNACGKYSINQSASMVKQAKLVITNDTGLMHIAAAFKKKVISLWGNTIPEFGMSPYDPGNDQNKIFEVKGLYCRPCSKIGFDHCPQKHFRCMNDLSVEEIVKEILKFEF